MKKFLFKVFALIAPVIIFLTFLEIKLSAIPNSYNTKRKQLETNLDSIQVLVLGSSQSLFGINPSYFAIKGYNISNVSQTLYYDTHITLKYLDKMHNLKCVLIPISYFSLYGQLIDGAESWRDYYYSQFWGIKYPEVPWNDLRLFSKIALYTPEVSFKFLRNGFHTDLVQNYRSNGWMFHDTTNIQITDSAAIATVKRHSRSFAKRFDENCKILDLLISELKKRKITPVLFTPPVFSSYYLNARQSKIDSTSEAILELCHKFNCSYYNYFRDPRFNMKDFYDCDHLDYMGAEKFSKILNKDILLNFSNPK